MATRTLFKDPPRDAATRAPALVSVRRRQDLLVAALFPLLLLLPLGANLLHLRTPYEVRERHEAAPFPSLEPSWASAASFGGRLRRYFEDNFGLREALVHAHALLDAQVLRVSPSPTVLWGREGWLFYADDGGLEDIAAESAFDARELEVWRTTLVDDRDWLRARGSEYVFTIAPDKHEIYPEYLPASLHRVGARTRADQLVAYLRAHTDLVIVDLKQALLQSKPEARLYDRTDTHWNRRGAYVAYRALMGAVSARVDGVAPPWPLSDFVPTTTITPGKDLPGMLGLRELWPEEDLGLEPLRPRQARIVEPPAKPDSKGDEARLVTVIPGSTLPRAVVFRDSFASRLFPYVSEHFSRTVYLWQHDLDLDVVRQEQPAVVIHEIVGRHLNTIVPWNPVAEERKRGAPAGASRSSGAASLRQR